MTRLPTSDPADRIEALDALRGFALCGILIINIYQTLHLVDLPAAIGLLFYQRFFVIFSLLFGIGFGMFLDSASAKTARPRLLLVRRLLVLGVFGALHLLLQPGEVLSWYAGIGLLVLLPFSYAPPAVVLVAGLLALAAGAATLGGVALVPGLFLIGLALASYGVPRSLPERTRLLAVLFGASALLAVVTYLLLTAGALTAPPVQRAAMRALALLTSSAWITGFLLLLRSPLRTPLHAVFAPLGRMALTNYLMATVLFVPIGRALGLEGSARWGTAVALSAGILVLQAVLSPLWLRVFRYGPLEWIWRCATWGRWVRNRREEPVAALA